ncbi:MAG: hypothetical protein KF686_03290 [Ramlibacter sp.]|nr:hypothetical protein [Ramlibacter sp.]
MADSNATPPENALTRMIDFRIPLWGVLGSCIVVVWALIGMYFQLQKVSENLAELQITVKSGNNQAMTLAGDIALLKFRIENLENSRQRDRR